MQDRVNTRDLEEVLLARFVFHRVFYFSTCSLLVLTDPTAGIKSTHPA